jgi:hypothetical protein
MPVKAYGTVLYYGSTADYSTSTFTAIAQVKSIKPFKVTSKEIDTTVLDSADEFDETLAGLANGGEAEVQLRYDKTQTDTLYGFFRTDKGWKMVYPSGSGWKWNGRITEFGDDEVVNGTIVLTTLKIKITGKPVHSASLS